MRVVLEAGVDASPATVFAAITGDPSTWTWFPIRVHGHVTGAGAPGVGASREFSMLGARVLETVLACEPPARWAYRGDSSSLPLFRALIELWTIEAHDGQSTVRWTLAADPRGPVAVLAALAAPLLRRTFRQAMTKLGQASP